MFYFSPSGSGLDLLNNETLCVSDRKSERARAFPEHETAANRWVNKSDVISVESSGKSLKRSP